MEILSKLLEHPTATVEVVLISSILMAFSWRFIFLQRKYLIALAMLALSLVILVYVEGLFQWIFGLGGDSFLESANFDISEAVFWASTLMSSASQMQKPFDKAMLMVAGETIVLSLVLYVAIRWRPVILRALVFAITVAVFYLTYLGYVGFEAGRAHINALQKQFDNNPRGFKASEDVDLFVYIGESTSSLNMSLYGYPRATTPRLEALYRTDEGFLRFTKVRSTHTHTSPSLLRTFAVTSPRQDGSLVIWGIGNVIKQAGLKPRLYSVQPLNGSFAKFSHFIFDGFDFNLSKEDRYKGNLSRPKVKDNELLNTALRESGVVFFHSYAGHGPYLDFIDTSLSNVIHEPNIGFSGMYGSLYSQNQGINRLKDSAEYEQAITYIDRNVAHAIESVKTRDTPAVLIYFSDHGEAVYAWRGHESSRFIDEMSTVPMIMYFNKAYREKYLETFSQYHEASLAGGTKFLDQVSPTILDILHIRSISPLDVPTLASYSKHPRPYIVERETVSGESRIDFEYDSDTGFRKNRFYGGTPEPTYISIINEKFGKENTICYHRSNSFAKALRAATIADCLEFDLVVDGDKLNVYHPPATSTGQSSLWIDSKNLSDPMACDKLASYLERNYARVGAILVEFPWRASERLIDLQLCGKRLRSIGVRTSYYVPTNLLAPCAENPTKNASACKGLNENVQKVMASRLFSDLSFDFIGYPAIKNIEGAKRLKWNTWTVKAQDFHHFPRRDFGFVIMDSSTDPNTY